MNRHSQRGQYATPNGHEADTIFNLISAGVEQSKANGTNGSHKPGDGTDSPGAPSNGGQPASPNSIVAAPEIAAQGKSGTEPRHATGGM